ncbi:MAG: GDSL-type esterase/lipase family protein [Deltaproteobacteria bacterium]|nr:GDSL-type esterase/lipase family protein [Deltaproteobacteria bacterium]
MGRIALFNPKEPWIIYSGSYVQTKFEGTSLSVTVVEQESNPDRQSWAGFIIDGKLEKVINFKKTGQSDTIEVAKGLTDKEHTLVVVKRTEFGVFRFLGVTLDAGKRLLSPGARSARRIECFGDSVTAGTHVEGSVGVTDPKTPDKHNGYYSWCSILGRSMGAEANVLGIPGEALYKGWGAGAQLFPARWQKLIPYDWAPDSMWNFASFEPQVVVVAMGQNDYYTTQNFTGNGDKENFKAAFSKLLPQMRMKYPNAHIILMPTCMGRDTAMLDDLTKAAIADYKIANASDAKVHFFAPSNSGTVFPDHPRVVHQEKMAADLEAFIKTLSLAW